MTGEVQNNSTTTSTSTRPGTNAKDPAELEKQIKEQLEERKVSIEKRLTTSNKNISSTEDEISQLESRTLVGVFARMSGQKRVLEEQIKDEKRFRAKIEIERIEFNKTSEKVEKLLKEGKVEEAKAVLDGREAEYKKNVQLASSRLATGYKQANQDLKDVDKFLANREQDIDKAHNRLVILASLLSFGKGKAIITAAKATAFGLTVGASSNIAEGLSNTFQYGQSGKESSKTAALKTGKDAWTSFKVGATAGLGKVIGGLKSLAELPKVAIAFISGSAVSAANSATDTTIGTITGEDKRTKTQKGIDFIKDTVIGGFSSMLGLKGEQWQQGKSAVASTFIRGITDVVAPTALNIAAGNAANKATGREAQTPDQVLDSTLDSTTSTLVGAHTNAKSSAQPNNSQPTPQAPKPASLPPLPSPLPPPSKPPTSQTSPQQASPQNPNIPPPPPPKPAATKPASPQNSKTPLPSQLPGKPPLPPPPPPPKSGAQKPVSPQVSKPAQTQPKIKTQIPPGIKPEQEVPTEDGLGVYVSERTLYHGSNVKGIKKFNSAEETTVGQGVYLTSSKDSGSGYAKKRALNKGGEPIIYTVKIKNAKLLDLRNSKNVQRLLKDYIEKNKDKVNQILTDPSKSHCKQILRQVGGIEGIGAGNFQDALKIFGTDLENYITEQGYDGLITLEGGEGYEGHAGHIGDHDSYVIFTPENVEVANTEDIKK